MYGVIFDFLRNYVIERHGGGTPGMPCWPRTAIAVTRFFPTIEYADAEIVALAQTASQALEVPHCPRYWKISARRRFYSKAVS